MAGEPLHLRMPADLGRAAHRRAARVGQRQGRDPRDAAPPRRRGRRGPHHRVLRPRARAPDRDGPARDRQHGRRAGRDHDRVPVRRGGAPLPARQGREDDWVELAADAGATYDVHDEIDLSTLEPLIALPSSPGNVVPVREVAGERDLPGVHRLVGQPRLPRLRDRRRTMVARPAQCHDRVSFDINPTLARRSWRTSIARRAMSRPHRTPARASTRPAASAASAWARRRRRAAISLRTVPRNFPGRSGTREDSVCLCQPRDRGRVGADRRDHRPAHAAASPYPKVDAARRARSSTPRMLVPPLPRDGEPRGRAGEGAEHRLAARASTPSARRDRRCRCCSRWATTSPPTRSCPPARGCCRSAATSPRSSEFAFEPVDPTYPRRARENRATTATSIVAGNNYGQGSSREHAALAPRYLGLRVVIARKLRPHPLAEPGQLRRAAADLRRSRRLRPAQGRRRGPAHRHPRGTARRPQGFHRHARRRRGPIACVTTCRRGRWTCCSTAA